MSSQITFVTAIEPVLITGHVFVFPVLLTLCKSQTCQSLATPTHCPHEWRQKLGNFGKRTSNYQPNDKCHSIFSYCVRGWIPPGSQMHIQAVPPTGCKAITYLHLRGLCMRQHCHFRTWIMVESAQDSFCAFLSTKSENCRCVCHS